MDDLIARHTFKIVILFLIVYGFYIVLHGHLSPGGGFAGGMILGLGIIMFFLLFSNNIATKTTRIPLNAAIFLICTGALLEAGKFLFNKGHSPAASPENLFSGGILNIVNLGIGLLVAATIMSIFYLEEK